MKEISKRLLSVLTAIAIIFTIFATPVGEIIGFVGEGVKAGAASYTTDYRNWSQGASDVTNMKKYGCWVTAQAKMLQEAGMTPNGFNPDVYLKWQQDKGYINSGFYQTNGTKAPCEYAKSQGYELTHVETVSSNIRDKIWENINNGYYTILYVTYTNSDGSTGTHYVMIANELSKKNNEIWIYNSYSSSTNAKPTTLASKTKWTLKSVRSYKGTAIDLTGSPNNLGTQFVAPIKVTSTGKVLTANADGNVTVADWKGTDNQRWIFTKNSSDNYYEIRNGQYVLKVLDVSNGGNTNDTNIQIWEDNDTSSQRFGIYGSQGSYVIKPKYSTTHVIDSDGGNSNVHLWQYYSSGIDAQKFTISPEPTTRFDTFSATSITTNDARVKCNAYKRSEDKAVKYGVVYAPADTWNNTPSRKTFYSTASTTNVGKTYREIYFDFGSEIGDTLKPDTTYNYYFVAVYNMDGVDMTFSSSVQSFKTSASCSTHSYGNWVTKTAASCTADGLKQRTCSKCGKIESATITKLGHSYTSSVTKVATCTATGVRTYKCSKCTYSYTENIAATGHSYGAWTSTAATCTEKGVSTRTCSKCSNVETNYINSLGHNYITYTIQPTYISKGFSHHLCSRCSAEYKDNYTSNIKSIPSTSFTVTASGKAVTLKIPTTPLIQGYTITRKCNGVVDKETSVTDSAYRSFNISGFNKERGANEIIVYTRYGTYAETNIYGNEIVVDADGYVIDERGYGSEVKSIVPKGGFVVSMHNPSTEFANIAIGDRVAYDMESKTLMVYYAGTAGESITYIDTTVENGKTYTYTVTPYVKNIKGSSSEKQVTITPSSVANFRSTAKTDKSLTLAWDKNTSGDGYVIQMLYGTTWKTIKTVSGNATTSCTITGLAPSVTYNFRICTFKTAYGRNYYSAFSSKMSAITLPSAVTGFTNPVKTDKSLTLSWNKNTSGTGYVIQMLKNGTWTSIKYVSGNTVTSYTVTGLNPSTTYSFRVCAYNYAYNRYYYGAFSSSMSAITLPTSVTGLSNSAKSTNTLTLSWNKNTSATGYVIQMQKDGVWTSIRYISGNTNTSYTVTGLNPGTTYSFRVCAYNYAYNRYYYGAFTSALTKTTKPSDMQSFTLGGRAGNALRLNWTKNTTAGGYIIEQYKDGKWVRIARIAGNATVTYRVEGLSPSTEYKFRMKAYKIDGSDALYSDYTSNLSAYTNPSAVSNLKITGKAGTALRLGWDKNTSTDGYIIEMYSGGKWVRVAKITSNATLTYRKAGLKKGTTYKFRVRTYNMVGSTALYGSYVNVSGTTNK